MDGARRQRSHLSIERFADTKLTSQARNALLRFSACQVIEAAKELQIFASGQTRVKTVIGSGVVSQPASNLPWFANGIITSDARGAPRGEQKRSQDPEQRGFAGAVRA